MEKVVESYKDSYEGRISARANIRIWSVEWANQNLKDGISELRNTDRDCDARICEVLVRIRLLRRKGFWWQAARLKNHLHKFFQDPRAFLQAPGGPDPPIREGGDS